MAELAKDFSVSTGFGVCTGVAVKRLSKDAMYGVGLCFMGLQTLSYLGYISINWGRVSDDITKAVDQDGDGKLTAADAKVIFDKFTKMMQTGLPNAAGFTTGLYAGMKLF